MSSVEAGVPLLSGKNAPAPWPIASASDDDEAWCHAAA